MKLFGHCHHGNYNYLLRDAKILVRAEMGIHTEMGKWEVQNTTTELPFGAESIQKCILFHSDMMGDLK